MLSIKEQEILDLAKRTQFHCDLLVEQCDNWLPPPEYDDYRNHKPQALTMSILDRLFLLGRYEKCK